MTGLSYMKRMKGSHTYSISLFFHAASHKGPAADITDNLKERSVRF